MNANVVMIKPNQIKVGMIVYGGSPYEGETYENSRWDHVAASRRQGWMVISKTPHRLSSSEDNQRIVVQCMKAGYEETRSSKDLSRQALFYVDKRSMEPEVNVYGEVAP